MDKRTLTALQGSIAKWQSIEDGVGYDGGAGNCPLCEEFMAPPEGSDCEECPVAQAVNDDGCSNTPYIAWATANVGRRYDGERIADTPQRVALAKAERLFLESLLPPGGASNES